MITKIQKWGNSQGLRFSKDVMDKMSIHIGDTVDVVVTNGQIVIKPISVVRGRYKIADLVKNVQDKVEEVQWGSPVGREVW